MMAKNKPNYTPILFLILLFIIAPFFTSAQSDIAKGGYGDMLYPYEHEYDQTFVYKIGVDYCPEYNTTKLNASQILDIIKKIDIISRGIPKMVYLVGWQYTGHDTGYPSFSVVNETLKNPDDETALESLKWLMAEAQKYNTLVSLHVNFSDIYLDDNPLGPLYKERDIIVRRSNGSYHEGYLWCNHMAYRASNYRNWNQGTFQNKQINPLFEMLPELLETASLHPDAWYNTSNPYYRITDEEDCEAMREMTTWVRQKYKVDITTEFDRRRPEGVDFVLFHPLLWHIEWDERTPPDPMKIPSYFQTGVNAKTWSTGAETVQSKFFGEIGDFEGIIKNDPENLSGAIKEFATRTLPWYFLNRHLRSSFDGNTARFTEGVVSSYPGKYTVQQSNEFVQDGTDIFIPVLWKPQKEIYAYSANGYQDRLWKLPESWNEISKADIYKLSFEGLSKKQKSIKVKNGRIELSLLPDEACIIIPEGQNFNNPQKPQSGEVEFITTDTNTQGDWIGKFGKDGWHIVGLENEAPDFANIKFINGADRIWAGNSDDIEALQIPGDELRIASQRYANLHEIVEVDFNDGKEHLISFYLLDWERTGRWTVVDVIDANTRKLIDSQNITNFGSGIYLTYRCKGKLQFRFTNVYTDRYTKSKDTGFSAIFFDQP